MLPLNFAPAPGEQTVHGSAEGQGSHFDTKAAVISLSPARVMQNETDTICQTLTEVIWIFIKGIMYSLGMWLFQIILVLGVAARNCLTRWVQWLKLFSNVCVYGRPFCESVLHALVYNSYYSGLWFLSLQQSNSNVFLFFLPVLHKSVLFHVTVRPRSAGFFFAPLFRTFCISLQV